MQARVEKDELDVLIEKKLAGADISEHLKKYIFAAALGDVKAQTFLGTCYQFGVALGGIYLRR